MLNCEKMAKLLPVIRREFSIFLYKKGKRKKEIARQLDITQSAVSQYLKMKRGKIKDLHTYKILKKTLARVSETDLDKINICHICREMINKNCYCR